MRVLMVCPDFPPERGGIQAVAAGLAANLDAECHVVTLDQPGAAAYDRGEGLAVTRVRSVGPRAVANAVLNLAVVAQALRRRPSLILCAHTVLAPAAAVIARLLRIPYVQMLYGLEVSARPRLARLAVRHASRVVVISRH